VGKPQINLFSRETSRQRSDRSEKIRTPKNKHVGKQSKYYIFFVSHFASRKRL
jgi:hypothetical protein